MKKLLPAIIICFLSVPAQAQKIDFTDSTNVWHVLSYNESTGSKVRFNYATEKYFNGSDTLINNLSYRKILKDYGPFQQPYTLGYTRYDSAANKVYAWNKNTLQDMVLYDYGLKPGDTFYSAMHYAIKDVYYTVKTVDSTLVNGEQYKRFILEITDTAFIDIMGTYCIYSEGVGNLTGAPLDPLIGDIKLSRVSELSRDMICFHNATNPISPSSRCADTILSVDDTRFDLKANIYPQPASNWVYIDLPEYKTGKISIYSINGQALITEDFIQKKQIKIATSRLNAGMYYLKLSTKDSKIYTSKLIVQ